MFDARDESPTESEIAAVVAQLRDKDIGTFAVVESFARQLPREGPYGWLDTVEKLETRRHGSKPIEDCRLFTFLLGIAVDEQRLARARTAAAAAPPPPTGLVEKVKRDHPEEYIRKMMGAPGFELETFLAVYVHDEAERDRLRGIARAAG